MNSFGKMFRITTWGESHGPAVGAVIDGCPSGVALDVLDIQSDLNRRKPGQSQITSSRKEGDVAEILSGVFEGKTIGTPISIIVKNIDAHSAHYQNIKNAYRPGHADVTWDAKFGVRDWRGGGRASARETVGRVAAGAVAKKILKVIGVEVVAYVVQVGKIKMQNNDLLQTIKPSIVEQAKTEVKDRNIKRIREKIEASIVRCPDRFVSQQMIEQIEEVRKSGDSVGGVVEVVAVGVPAGIGEPVFGKLSAYIGAAFMSIPAVKGVEIGSGFVGSSLLGSQHNDSIEKVEIKKGKTSVHTKTNNAGGMLGGISTGMPVVARVAFKPASSIYKEQKTVDLQGKKIRLKVEGRHDPCVVPRAVPVVESMMALTLVDLYLQDKARK